MLAGVTDCGRSRKWGCRGRLAWDLKPGVAAIAGEDHRALAEKGENHAALAEWGPRGSNSADGACSLNHRLLLLFLRCGTPDWAEGEGRTV